MFMLQRLVDVLVFVPLGDVQPNADHHENSRSAKTPTKLALSNCKGKGRPGKWRGGKVRARASRPEVTERLDEQDEADAITKKPNNHDAQGDANRRYRWIHEKSEPSIYRSSHQTLPHGNLRWVAARNLASEIVINPPTKAGGSDQYRGVRDREAIFFR